MKNRYYIGNNFFEDVDVILDMAGFIPLRLKFDDVPHVWLSVHRGKLEFPIVEDNVSRHDQVSVSLNNSNRELTVSLHGGVIIHIYYDNEMPRVDRLDLRLIGIRMYLDGEQLHVGEQTYSNCRVSGFETFVEVKDV